MEYRTRSLSFAAFATATQKLTLLRIEVQKRIAYFVFDDPEHEAESLYTQFQLRQTLAEPSAYHAQLRTLRSMIDQKMAHSSAAGVSNA